MNPTLLVCLLVSLTFTEIHAQHYVWGRSFTSEIEGGATGRSIFVDDNDDIIICGDYDGNIDFGNYHLQSREGHDGFIAKLDSSGAVLWAKTLGSAGNGGAFYSIDKGISGSLYAVGEFSDSLYLEHDTIAGGSEAIDGVLTKYDESGNLQWIKHFPGSRVRRVKTDVFGNAYILGHRFIEGMTLGVWISKFDEQGNEIFYSELFSPSLSGGLNGVNIAIDPDENVYISALAGHEALIGSIFFSGNFEGTFVIIKCDSQGTPVWVQAVDEVPSGGAWYTSTIAVDGAGNIFHSTFQDMLSLSKFDTRGNLLWSKRGSENIGIAQILIDEHGNLLTTGRFQGEFTLDAATFKGPAQGTFVALFNNLGECQWSLQGQNEGNNYIFSLARNQKTGDLYAAGVLSSTSPSFGKVSLPDDDISLRAFVLKIAVGSDDEPELLALSIPNVITPDGDEYNQYFTIPELDITRDNALFIFNRYGTLIYSTPSYRNDWESDGLASGIYYYRLHNAADSRVYKGWMHVMK